MTRLRAAGCVFAEDEARLLISAARTPGDLAVMVDRRAAGQPLEHVLGWAEFCGLRIAVDPGVFIPRRRTEFLVQQAADLARRDAGPARAGGAGPARPRPVVVVDLCCGSGAVGAALAAAVNPVELHATDIDPAAVRCARRNVAAAGGQVYRGDLYAPLPARLRGRVDILAANVPYVPTGAVGLLPQEARVHEPRVALDGGADGLDAYRAIAADALRLLASGGWLILEIGIGQADAVTELVGRAGLAVPLAPRPDLANLPRVIMARRDR